MDCYCTSVGQQLLCKVKGKGQVTTVLMVPHHESCRGGCIVPQIITLAVDGGESGPHPSHFLLA
jgi:hypothetical protein